MRTVPAAHLASAAVTLDHPPEEAWKDLTDGARMTRWFADAEDLAPGAPFRFDFGDGDFFVGRVLRWEPPRSLSLSWRFMGVGPTFDVRFDLLPASGRTEVRVEDRGSRSAADAEVLREGWTDFLARLQQFARTGERARYDWSPVIGVGSFAAGAPSAVLETLRAPRWWEGAFGPGVSLGAQEPARQSAEFLAPSWGGVHTRAVVTAEDDPRGTYLAVTHGGWPELPGEIRIAERRRVAGLWARALDRLEAR